MAFEYAIVLTGSIATGKSTVANFLKKDGFTVIDADKIAHTILDEEYKQIAKLFGDNCVVENIVQRKVLGNIVFKDEKKRKILEDLLHPLIYVKIKSLSEYEDMLKKPYFIDIPLFFEAKRYAIDKSLVVYTPKKLQLKRLIQRDGYNEEEALSRIEIQIDIEKKRQLSTYVIDNSGDIGMLKYEYECVKEQILGDFK